MSEHSSESTSIPTVFYVILVVIAVLGIGYVFTSPPLLETLGLILYGAIGFFSALSFGLFFGGWTLYLVRAGQEYRQDGIYIMMWGVRILTLVVCGILFTLIIS